MSDTPAEDRPATPEGELIRYHVDRLNPRPTAADMALRFGWSVEKWGNIARGRNRSRNGQPAREHHPSVADLVLIATELGITPEELDGAGERGRLAAERLRSSPPPERAQPGQDLEALFGAHVEALIAKLPAEAEMLRWLWYRAIDGDGRPKPAAERMRDVTAWLRDHPAAESSEAG